MDGGTVPQKNCGQKVTESVIFRQAGRSAAAAAELADRLSAVPFAVCITARLYL